MSIRGAHRWQRLGVTAFEGTACGRQNVQLDGRRQPGGVRGVVAGGGCWGVFGGFGGGGGGGGWVGGGVL